MEDKSKKVSIENIYEDMSTLKLKQHKLILKKKEMSKKIEMNKLLTSDNIRQLTHWDLILLQIKFMALDMHEERKWKKGIYCVLSKHISTKVKKSNRKKKLSELYKRCMCLYLSMNINNNLADISLGKENKNMNDQLNNYIKTISNIEYFNKQFSHWKVVLADIKNKLQKKFGEKNLGKAKNFFIVVDLMENMINMQEETVKRLNELNERSRKEKERYNLERTSKDVDDCLRSSLTNFIADIDYEMNNSDRFKIEEHEFYHEYVENNFNSLDLNKLSKEINEVIEGIVNTINDEDEAEIFLNSSILNTSNSINKSLNGSTIIPVNSINNQSLSIQSSINESSYSNKTENELILSINPKQLFYGSQPLILNDPQELKIYLEKILKTESDKIEILPSYNYSQIAGSEIDTNKDVDEFTKIYFKVFPTIYFTERTSFDKMIIESTIDIYKNKHDRILKDSDLLKLFNLKFDKFTHLQQLILLWGLSKFGINYSILSEIPNIFTFAKSLSFDNEEIFIYLDRLLETLKVDLLASNFELLNVNGRISPGSNHYVYCLDPPMLNSTQCNFYYNKKMYDYVQYSKKSINNSDISLCYPNVKIKQNKITTNSTSSLNQNSTVIQFPGVNLIYLSPILKNYEMKQLMFEKMKEDLKKICRKVEFLYESYNQSTLTSHNYLTMSINTNRPKELNVKPLTRKPSINSISNGMMHIQNNSNISAEALNQLTNQKIDFSVFKNSELALDSTKPNVRQDTLEGVSFYSQQSIQKEWEILRNPWYQNNTQFKPKFRKPNKPVATPQTNPTIPYQTTPGNLNIFKNLNDNRAN